MAARELKSLSGLRFPAALLVFTQHLPAWALPAHPAIEALQRAVFAQAQAALSVFFVLSGFVLAHAYARRLQADPSGRRPAGAVGDFLAGRLARLFPLHLLALALILPLAAAAGETAWLPLLAHLTLTQALVPDGAVFAAYNAPSWALSAELVFAPFFPFLLMRLTGLSTHRLFAVLAVLTALPLAGAMLADAAGRSGFFALYINPFARLAEFASGVALQTLWRRGATGGGGTAREIAAVAALFLAMAAAQHLPVPYRLVCLYLPVALAMVAVLATGDGAIGRLLASKPMRMLGRLSLAFYAIHFVVIRYAAATPLAQLAADDGWRWILAPALALLSLGAAAALHVGVERVVERRLRQRLGRLLSRAPS